MSACVTVWVAVQIIEVAARALPDDGWQVPSAAPMPGSVTVTPVNVWFPVLVTVIGCVITAPKPYGPVEGHII